MSYIIGCDPGCSGAIVVLLSRNCPEPVEWMPMPTIKNGKSSRVNASELSNFLANYDAGTAYIESVHSMPGQGVASSFGFGHAAGVLEGVLTAMRIPVVMVTPQTWKKRAGLIGTKKDASRSAAIRRWPRWADLSKKGAGQAYADAAFIALYGDAG